VADNEVVPTLKLTRRAASSDDLELLFEINRAALEDHVRRNFGVWDDEQQRRSFGERTDPSTHQLFYSGSQPAGFWSVARDDGQICLERLCLFPSFQNRGLGTLLVRELIAEARASDRALRLQVFLTNRARRLYERLGFRIVRATDSHYHMEYAALDVQFAFLADHPELVPTVAEWWFDEWARPGARLEDSIQHVAADLHTDTIPVQVIAFHAGSVVGSAVLKHHELWERYPDLEGWLGNVFVAKAVRGKGVASALCARVIDLALELGLPALHLQTQDVTGGLYVRLGWRPIDRTVVEGRDTLIMKRRLASRAG
jgi:GNAT superfamily N-acetyltransferase